ncbi:MAG: helix-turn-helix domain-containing protein [Gordonia paraffinivorans]
MTTVIARSGFSVPTRTTSTTDWADLLRTHFVGLDTAVDQGDVFTGAVTSREIAHLQLSTVSSVSQVIERTTRLIRDDRDDYLQVARMTRGSAVVRQDGRECSLGRADFVLYDTTRPFLWRVDGDPHDGQWAMEVFTWPRVTLGLPDRDIASMTAVRLDGSVGVSGLLGRFLHDLVVSRDATGVRSAPVLADEISGFVSGVVRLSTVGHVPGRTDFRDRVDHFIDENLSDPTLSPPAIALAMSISTRQLHRLFAESGESVSQFIRRRRLEQCRRDILSNLSTDRSMQQISRRWGFRDLAVFSRAFRTQYGVSPRQYREAASRAEGVPVKPRRRR